MWHSKSWSSTISFICVVVCSVSIFMFLSTPCHPKSTISSCDVVHVKPGGGGVHWLIMFTIAGPVPVGMSCCGGDGVEQMGFELVEVVTGLVVWVVQHR